MSKTPQNDRTLTPEPPAPAEIREPHLAAFSAAQRLATASRVMRLEAAALDLDDDDGSLHGCLLQNLAAVRRALIDARRDDRDHSQLPDYDGDQLSELLDHVDDGKGDEDLSGKYLYALINYQEAAYLYGLALGLLLGKGKAQ